MGAYVVSGAAPVSVQFEPDQPQVVQLQIVMTVLEKFPEALNIVSDSKYVVNAMQVLETPGLIRPTSKVTNLLLSIQTLLQNRPFGGPGMAYFPMSYHCWVPCALCFCFCL